MEIQEVSKLETEIMKERLSSLFLNVVFKYARVTHIMEKARRAIDIPLKAPASAHRAVILVLSIIAKEDTPALFTSQSTLFSVYAV